jgi:hypothetical protein
MAAEGEQSRLVTLDEYLKRGMLPLADESDQLLVALEAEQRRPPSETGERSRWL